MPKWTDHVVTEHHSKIIGEQNFDSGMAPLPLPVVTLPHLIAPHSFGWLLRFPVPHPLPLIVPLSVT
jgi:hypothetical protein